MKLGRLALMALAPLAGVSPLAAFDDCNQNGIPDDQDLAAGSSEDCNRNGIPDECDTVASTGWVEGQQKISATQGGFQGGLASYDQFGSSVPFER